MSLEILNVVEVLGVASVVPPAAYADIVGTAIAAAAKRAVIEANALFIKVLVIMIFLSYLNYYQQIEWPL